METSLTSYKIRVANQSDTNNITKLVLKASSESPLFEGVEMDEPTIKQTVEYFVDKEATIVVEVDNVLVGLILADVGQLWYSKDISVNEMLFYISPEYRGGRLSVKLVNAFIDNAKLFTPSKITIGGGLHPKYYDKLEKFYSRFGFTLEGFTMKLGD